MIESLFILSLFGVFVLLVIWCMYMISKHLDD